MKILEKRDKENCQKEYKIEVERQAVEEKANEILHNYKKEATIPGFRKGKAPLNLLTKRFGKYAEEEAISKILPPYVEEIAKEEGLRLSAEPELISKTYEEGQPLICEILIEHYPIIPLGTYKGIEVEVETKNVTDDDIDRIIKNAQKNNAIFEPKEGDKVVVEDTDGIVIDYETKYLVDDVEKKDGGQKTEDYLLKDLNYIFKEDEIKLIVGKTKGEVVEFDRDLGPIGGKDGEEKKEGKIHFKIAIKDVKKKVLPEIDDDFAKDLGDFKDLADLKAKIREDLEKQKVLSDKKEVINKVAEKLVDSTEFDVPATIQSGIGNSILKQDHSQAKMYGKSLDDIYNTEESQQQYVESIKTRSKNFAKYSLILGEISRIENLEITDEDLRIKIEEIAREQGRKPLAIRAELEKNKQIENMKNELFSVKVENFLFENAVVKYLEPKDEK